MTNHPRSPRAKFKVGQVVYFAKEKDYFVVSAIRKHFLWLICEGSRYQFSALPEELRPLTKKEAGR